MRSLWLALALLCSGLALAWAQGVDPTIVNPSVFPGIDGGGQFVRLEPNQVFWDDFGTGTLDTTNRWASPTASGGGTAATSAVGLSILGSGTTANGFSFLQSKASFAGRNPGYVTIQYQINFEFPALTNAYRFWGVFTAPGSPTATAPLTNAVGFAIDTAGKLRAQTWASGTINVNIDLSIPSTGAELCNCVGQPSDSAVHKYQVWFRGDNILWFVDGKFVARVLTGAGGPDVNTLPTGALAVAGATPPTSTATLQLNQVTVGDSSRTAQRICDATYSWQCMPVAIIPTVTGSALNNLVLKAAPGNLLSVYATNLTATAGFLVVLNSTTSPGDGAITPLDCVPLPANGIASINYGPNPSAIYSTGMTAVVSSATTCFTKTTGTITAFIKGAVQ
jgi:hypothetical protein